MEGMRSASKIADYTVDRLGYSKSFSRSRHMASLPSGVHGEDLHSGKVTRKLQRSKSQVRARKHAWHTRIEVLKGASPC